MIHKTLHITLILIVLLSSTGFAIQRHFCQNELKGVSLFGKAENCHNTSEEKPSCPMHKSQKHNHNDQDKKTCCDDQVEFVKLNQEFYGESFQLSVHENPLLIGIIFIALRLPSSEDETSFTHFLNYKPPLIVCDFEVKLQTFLC